MAMVLQASSGVNFLVCLLMMFVDTLLYCAVGLYLDKVHLGDTYLSTTFSLPTEHFFCQIYIYLSTTVSPSTEHFFCQIYHLIPFVTPL